MKVLFDNESFSFETLRTTGFASGTPTKFQFSELRDRSRRSFDLRVSALVEPSHEEPIGQLAARDRQAAAMAGQLAELAEVNEALAAKLARLEHGAERMLEGWDEQRRDHGA